MYIVKVKHQISHMCSTNCVRVYTKQEFFTLPHLDVEFCVFLLGIHVKEIPQKAAELPNTYFRISANFPVHHYTVCTVYFKLLDTIIENINEQCFTNSRTYFI